MSIYYKKLPEDMRVLISDFVQWHDEDRIIPAHLPTRILNLDQLPSIPLDEYDRGTAYALEMQPGETPPIIIAHGKFLDGKHRVFSARHRGDKQIEAIDLTGIADIRMVDANQMGDLGP
jgi:hypothetical protein